MKYEEQTKDTWKELALNELRGESLDDISIEIEPGLTVDPIGFPGEEMSREPIPWNRNDNRWKIGQHLPLSRGSDPEKANEKLLALCQAGCEVVHVGGDPVPDPAILLRGIDIDQVRLRIYGGGEVKNRYLQHFDDHPHVTFYEDDVVCPDADLYPSMWLYEVLVHAEKRLSSGGQWKDIIVTPYMSNRLWLDVAAIRALKLLVYASADLWGADISTLPVIQARVANDPDLEGESQLVAKTTRAFGAAMAGVDEIVIDEGFDSRLELSGHDVSRISTGIHHLLTMESQLHLQADPLHGSFWIEHVTEALFERALERYKKNG